jgi:hypothetical protein
MIERPSTVWRAAAASPPMIAARAGFAIIAEDPAPRRAAPERLSRS